MYFGQGAGSGVVVEGGYCAVQFVDDVSLFGVWGEGEVSRACAGFQVCRGWVVGGYRSIFGIESVNVDLVDSEVCNVDVAVVRAWVYRVGVGAFLTSFVNARAFMLGESGGFGEPAIGLDWDYRGAAAAVVGDEDVFAGAVDIDVAWT